LAGFIYNGKSTEEFLPDDLAVGFFDGSTDGYGLERELQRGTPTLSRPIPNEYGALEAPAEITLSLLKCSAGLITKEEQIKIETWLTEPKLSTPLYFIPSGKKTITGPTPYYYGIFTRTEWIPGGGGFQAVKLTFQPTTVYPFMKVTEKINLKGNTDRKISVSRVDDSYIYPVITLKDNNGDFSVLNTTTGDHIMKLTGISSISELSIDCKNCIITDLSTGKTLSFSEIGWKTV